MLLPPRAPHFDAALRDAREASPRGRATAALVLGQPPAGREREARPALARLCRDAEEDVRFAAMVGLGRVGDASVLVLAIEGIGDSSPQVREAAVIAVGRIGGEGAHAALRRALDSEHGEVRFQAGPALVELRGEDARTEVLVLLADERPTVRANAVRALAELAPHAPTAARFARLLEDPDREVRLEAALALEDDARALPVLRAALASGALPEEDLFRVLDGLGRRGDVAALPLVHRLATSLLKPRPVKAAAAAALARMNDPRGVALLRPFLVGLRADQRDFVLGVVGALGLTELAPEVRSLLARPAGASPESLAAALVALADRDPTLREEERRALGRGDAFAEALRAARAAAEEAREHDGP